MSAPTRSIEEIVASVVRKEKAEVARVGPMHALLGASAAAFAALLLLDAFLPETSAYLVGLDALGPPLRLLLVFGVVGEGLGAAFLLQRHEEAAYPLLVQQSATSLAAAGATLLGVGALLSVLYSFLLGRYWPEWILMSEVGRLVLLAGAGAFLAALAPAACSILRFQGAARAE